MAVELNPLDSAVQIKYEMGIDPTSGNTKYSNRTLTGFSPDADDNDIWDIVLAIAICKNLHWLAL